jgi:hypothetical protein
MYYIGIDVHKKTISYCVKDAAGGRRGTYAAEGRETMRVCCISLPESNR